MAVTLNKKSVHTVIRSLFGKVAVQAVIDASIHVTIGGGQITFYDGDLMIGQGDLTMNTAMAIIKKKLPTTVKLKVNHGLKQVMQDVLEYCQMDAEIEVTENPNEITKDDYDELVEGVLEVDDEVYKLENVNVVGLKVSGTTAGSIYYSTVCGLGIKVAVRITETYTVSIRVIETKASNILTSFGLSASSGYSSTHLSCKDVGDVIKLIGAFNAAVTSKYPKAAVMAYTKVLKANGITI